MPVNDSPFKHFRNLGGHGQDAGMGEVALDRQREVIQANVIGQSQQLEFAQLWYHRARRLARETPRFVLGRRPP